MYAWQDRHFVSKVDVVKEIEKVKKRIIKLEEKS
jgi:hypothetical protein